MKCFEFIDETLIHLFKMDEKTFFFSALSLEDFQLFDDIADILIFEIVIRLSGKCSHEVVYQFYFCGKL